MSKEVQINEGIPALSRRQFLRAVAAFGGVLLIDQVLPRPQAQAQTVEPPESQPDGQPFSTSEPQAQMINDKSSELEPSLMDTAKESIVFTAAKLMADQTLRELGVPLTPTSESMNEKILKKPLKAFMEGVVLAPLIEEALFRLFPSWILSYWTKDTAWAVGVPISVTFAYAHNFQEEEQKKYTFLKDKLPIPHFMAGLYFWMLMRERGFSHATTAHGVGNFASMMAARVYNKVIPGKP